MLKIQQHRSIPQNISTRITFAEIQYILGPKQPLKTISICYNMLLLYIYL